MPWDCSPYHNSTLASGISTFLKQLLAMSDRRRLGRNNQCVLHECTDAQLAEMWKTAQSSLQSENEDGCRFWTGSTANGYPSLSRGHAKSKIRVHILSVFMQRKELPGSSEVCSHLCHEKLCCNPNHIVIESIIENSRRNRCLCKLQMPDGTSWNLCPHEPRCLKIDRSNLGEFTPSLLP